MYESPLTRICNDITNQIIKQEEDKIVCEIRQAIGYNIDKQELVKALQYDREQYQKGYADAMAIIDDIKAEIAERIKLYEGSCDQELGTKWGYEWSLEIIDKHTKEGE